MARRHDVCGIFVVEVERLDVVSNLMVRGMVWVEFCFFFQAEDGIRDIGVTGVQTCALPI